ncbi:hypothetical protein I3842_04G046900 [Carya illinoinensis]|uniref:Secreted protein n=1 Tax=Carya illinoinensis TaxID=32201 RepID=A0A922JQ98_CARIL|nr:hypothetical protein I3842_04G046900 [Carya illinoinensis]KAG6716394.1 hypothetical protein I3842_04G046900 [Carya illinoinensis]
MGPQGGVRGWWVVFFFFSVLTLSSSFSFQFSRPSLTSTQKSVTHGVARPTPLCPRLTSFSVSDSRWPKPSYSSSHRHRSATSQPTGHRSLPLLFF